MPPCTIPCVHTPAIRRCPYFASYCAEAAWRNLRSVRRESLETVRRAVGIDNGPLAFRPAYTLSMLHAQHSVKALCVDVAEYILVVDLARSRFFPPRIITNVKSSNMLPRLVDIGYQIAFADLVVIQIIDDFAAGVVHALANELGLGDIPEETTRMVGPPV